MYQFFFSVNTHINYKLCIQNLLIKILFNIVQFYFNVILNCNNANNKAFKFLNLLKT